MLPLCREVDASWREVQSLLCSTWTFSTNSKPSAAAVHAPEVLDDMLQSDVA